MKGKKAFILVPLLSLFFTGCAEDLGERLESAGLNTLMGIGIVFLMLILISLLISAFNLIHKAEENAAKKKEEKLKKDAGEEPAPETPVETVTAPEAALTEDTELVAVIAAAIAAYEGTSPDGVVIRSIRNRNAAAKWKRG